MGLGLLLVALLSAGAPAEPLASPEAKQALRAYLSAFKSGLPGRNAELEAKLRPLLARLNDLQTTGKPVACAYQIQREIQWRLHFTSDLATIRRRLDDLARSLGSEQLQIAAAQQSPNDGAWGGCYEVPFMKLYASAEALDGIGAAEVLRYPATFLDPINSPERLTARLRSIVVNDFYKTGILNRVEIDDTISALGRLILNGLPHGYPFHPGLKAAYLAFLDDWQNPDTGSWGTWFVAKDGRLVKTDDIGISFHIVSQRKGQVRHLDRIGRRVLALKDADFPIGYRVNGHYENHLNWDAARLLRSSWSQLDEASRAEARKEISRMLDFCLHESYRPDGSFKTSELDETAGEALLDGVMFLDEIGYFSKSRRFWTEQPFPEATGLLRTIETHVRSMGLVDSSLKAADDRLGAIERGR